MFIGLKRIYKHNDTGSTEEEKLFFYGEEIAIMNRRLREVFSNNSSIEILARVRHFQQQLAIQEAKLEQIQSEYDVTLQKDADYNDSTPHLVEYNACLPDFENEMHKLRMELSPFLLQWL